MADYSPYQKKIIKRYYQNFDAIKLAMEKCDALVFPGGSVFQDASSVMSVKYYHRLVSMAKAKKLKIITCGMLGRDGGKCKTLCDIPIVVPHSASCRIQEVHKFLYHTICEWVDSKVD